MPGGPHQQRVLIYSHDTYGIGNIRRTLEICWSLSDRLPEVSILLVTGSPQVECFRKPPNVDYVKLPELKRAGRGRYRPRATGFQHRDVRGMRSEICESAMLRFAPDLVVVDKAPFGVDGELQPALEHLRDIRPDCIRVLALRDILDEPAVVRASWQQDGTAGDILAHYDAVWVFGSRELFDVGAAYDMPAALRERLIYLGFIGRNEPVRDPQAVRAKLGVGSGPLVLVTAGGGDDGERLLTTYATALPLVHRARPEVTSVVVAGPNANARTRERLQTASRLQPGVVQLDFTPDIFSLMNAASCVVCMGGYNTSSEVLMLGKPALIVPRSEPVQEQSLRARMLAELGAVRLCEPSRLTPSTLVHEVNALLDGWRPVSLNGSFTFTGHALAADAAAAALGARRAAPCPCASSQRTG